MEKWQLVETDRIKRRDRLLSLKMNAGGHRNADLISEVRTELGKLAEHQENLRQTGNKKKISKKKKKTIFLQQ